MIVLESNEAKSHEAIFQFSQEIGADWNGEELNHSSEDGSVRIISSKYFGDAFINIGQIKWKEGVFLRNRKISENRIVLRVMRTGIEGRVGKYRINSSNNIIMFNTNQELELRLHKNVQTEWIAVTFPSRVFQGFADDKDFKLRALIDKHEPWFNYFSLSPEIESHIRSMYEIRDNRSLRRTVFLAKVIEILGLLKQQLESIDFGVTTNKTSAEIEKMIAIKNELLADYTKTPNLKELADKSNVSESTLQRSFKELFHQPILKFFNQNRLEEAHRQIKYTERSITEISYTLGYSHVHHLSNSFKKHFGYSPNALRSKKKINPVY